DGTWNGRARPHPDLRASGRFFSIIWPLSQLGGALLDEAQRRVAVRVAGVSPMTEPSLPEESIFAQALEIASTAERAAFLDRACGNNQALRAEVEALLRAHERSGDLLDLPENQVLTTDPPAHDRPGPVI